jgi:hypothetical protein
MKPIVYIESSVISYLVSRPNRDVVIAGRQAISHDWWNNHRYRFNLRVSSLVEEEIGRGDPLVAERRLKIIEDIPLLSISDEAVNLANALITKSVVPENSKEDALHISIAAAQGVDFLLTWNFKHINNAEKKSAISLLVDSFGFVCPQICSPEELGENSND